MEAFLSIFTIIWLFFIGAGFFSILYALCLRLEGRISGKDYVCENCGMVLPVKDLIPVFSYLFLKGRCRSCGEKIPAGELVAEIAGGLITEAVFFRFGRHASIKGAIAFSGVLDITATISPWKACSLLLIYLVFCLLFMVTVIDHDTMMIPDKLSIAMLILGAASVFCLPVISIPEHLIGLVAVSLPLLLITLAIPGAFGGGDIKLMAGAGLFLGWKLVLVALFLGILTGGCYAIWLLARKKTGRKGHFAFGPFLCFGIALSMIAGDAILSGYLQMAGRLYRMGR
ncbi:MAG: prepilin peptidase [Lachnospiraceae bacterium]|nr:prepilin peptidase [Lachnospiraceae bacterium]